MANHERYVSVTELKGELPFTAADFPVQDSNQFETALARALGSASDLVEKWGETVYQTETITESVARPAHVADVDLPLSKRPIQSVTSVSVEGTSLTESDDYVVVDTHLSLIDEPASDVQKWPTAPQSITVDWTYGYEEVPGPVSEAIIRLARSSLDQIETDGYTGDDEGWQYRTPASVKAECAALVDEFSAPSYYGGASIV